MKEIISITEMAKLRNISTETLRHYDRIDLLKPVHVDPDTGYRYYSITQYEKIGTIRELKNLGMSLREIKEYFDNRNVESSRILLTEQKKKIDEQIDKLIRIRQEINAKIDFLDIVRTTDLNDEIRIKHFKARQYVYFNRTVSDDIELSYDSVSLERVLSKSKQSMPIFATNRYGGLVSRADILKNVKPLSAKMIILYDGEEDVDECNIIEAPEGDYLCMFYVGNFWNREESIEKMLTYMKENDLVLAGDVLQMQWVDFAITDNLDDISYEFQIPVKPLFSEKR
ncbi:MAG: MerR family transcriptional regulator [Clostridiales bacterium]|jgi:DNA-binding transcriptional MerR regulator/effector-binding domain-containing protein|nr:MerR family transcriptional regulator [Clostridiales bacterium]